ncbi:MAG: YciI family protein [Xanthomonadales bacterium]|nr:YciI family protein [Xanthomonadales bacterium]
MKYMALIYAAENAGPQYDTDEFNQLIEEYQSATEQFESDGVLVSGDALQDINTATTISIREGKTETIDGPFAETKEQLGGYYLFDCESLDQALKYAAMIPSAKYGRIEVRPLMDYSE